MPWLKRKFFSIWGAKVLFLDPWGENHVLKSDQDSRPPPSHSWSKINKLQLKNVEHHWPQLSRFRERKLRFSGGKDFRPTKIVAFEFVLHYSTTRNLILLLYFLDMPTSFRYWRTSSLAIHWHNNSNEVTFLMGFLSPKTS